MQDRVVRSTDRRRGPAALLVAALVLAVLVAPARARAQSELTGIDVSNHQHQIDWLAVGGTGHAFVFAKATEGTTFTDVTFPLNRSGAKVAGMRFGAYHFARPSGGSDAAATASAVAQADYFLSFAAQQQGDLLPVLDLEDTGGLSVERLSLWTQAWLGEVVARTGIKPIVYVSPSFWKERVGDSPIVAAAGHRLWIAHWTKAALPILPGASWGGLGWSFWQWTNCEHVDGISSCVDGDRLNGTSFAGVTIPPFPLGAPTSAAAPTIVGSPQTAKLLTAVPGSWGGGKPVTFGYQWQRCAAPAGSCSPIASATANTYTPTAVDVGHPLLVRVTATTSQGTAASSSAPTLAVAGSGVPVGGAPRVRTLPLIEGVAQVGQVLTGTTGTWNGSPTSFSYQWRRCNPDGSGCAAIPDAGAGTYTITPGDLGAALSLAVTAVGAGGAGSATSVTTAVVTPAPTPPPAIGTTVAQAGQAGAVATSSGRATATWQPGTLPDRAAVALVDITSRLSLPGTATRLSFGAASPLPWPVDVQFPSAPADTVPGILPLKGVWQPLAELPSATLPVAQQAGSYRDASGTLHVLTRTPGRIALFAAGRWGDPRFTTASAPRLALATGVDARATSSGGEVVIGRITLDTQAHLYVSLAGANGRKLLLPAKGARIGWWLKGTQAKTLQALQTVPGSLPIRLRIPPARSGSLGPYTLRVVAVDPYGRRSSLTAAVAPATSHTPR